MISLRMIVGVQGVYYLATGLWPLVHFGSFEAVTGPKVDDWLVRMVALLIVMIGATLITAARRSRPGADIFVLAVGSPLAFIAVDVWYTATGVIAPIYLADAAVEVVLVALLVLARRQYARVWQDPPTE